MTALSDILNSKFPSPTALIAAVTGGGTVSYTATGPTKVHFVFGSPNGTVTINGASISNSGSGNASVTSFDIYVNTGQTLSMVVAAAAPLFISAERAN